MIWADRAGIGLAALSVLAIALVLIAGGFYVPAAPWLADPLAQSSSSRTPSPNFFDQFDTPKPNSGQRLYTDAEVGIVTPDAPFVAAAKALSKVVGFVVVPAWLVMRIVDFVFAGPTRRRRARKEASAK